MLKKGHSVETCDVVWQRHCNSHISLILACNHLLPPSPLYSINFDPRHRQHDLHAAASWKPWLGSPIRLWAGFPPLIRWNLTPPLDQTAQCRSSAVITSDYSCTLLPCFHDIRCVGLSHPHHATAASRISHISAFCSKNDGQRCSTDLGLSRLLASRAATIGRCSQLHQLVDDTSSLYVDSQVRKSWNKLA